MSVDDYCNYLQSKGFVSINKIPYYSRWLSQFLQFSCRIEVRDAGLKNVFFYLLVYDLFHAYIRHRLTSNHYMDAFLPIFHINTVERSGRIVIRIQRHTR
jgi:hypothetical protein